MGVFDRKTAESAAATPPPENDGVDVLSDLLFENVGGTFRALDAEARGLVENVGAPYLFADNRAMRPVLASTGSTVVLEELSDGHTWGCWRDSLGVGLVLFHRLGDLLIDRLELIQLARLGGPLVDDCDVGACHFDASVGFGIFISLRGYAAWLIIST